jgi:hypothetical protein
MIFLIGGEFNTHTHDTAQTSKQNSKRIPSFEKSDCLTFLRRLFSSLVVAWRFDIMKNSETQTKNYIHDNITTYTYVANSTVLVAIHIREYCNISGLKEVHIKNYIIILFS